MRACVKVAYVCLCSSCVRMLVFRLRTYACVQVAYVLVFRLRTCACVRVQVGVLDKGLTNGILLTGSKVFDCISHDLLIAKLHAYGYLKTSLKLIFNYLNKEQK